MAELNVSHQRSLEQERAEHAWNAVQSAKRALKDKGKELRSLARSAPASIQSNGLGQTLAFWKAKKEPHHSALYDALSDWLKKQLGVQSGDLVEWIATTATSLQYRHATAEAMAYLNWYKRFAEADLKSE